MTRLLQDVPEPWKHFVICSLLNRTRGEQVAKVLPGFFRAYPTACKLSRADALRVEQKLASLGLSKIRAQRVIDIARWFDAGRVPYASGWPPGTGEYARQSYQILFFGERPGNVTDKRLQEEVCRRLKNSNLPSLSRDQTGRARPD